MKTSEFKKELRKLGYGFEEGHVYNLLKRTVARVKLDETNVLDSFWGETISYELFSLLTRYAATPIAEREDNLKLFNVQIIKGNWGRESWLYRYDDYDVRTSFSADNNDLDQQWTLEQIKEYGIDDETVYKRVPVED